MDLQKCARCKDEEYIPTYQFVKMGSDLEQQRYLCSCCWNDFKKWYYNAKKQETPSLENTCNRCKTLPESSVTHKIKFDDKIRTIDDKCFQDFYAWWRALEL